MTHERPGLGAPDQAPEPADDHDVAQAVDQARAADLDTGVAHIARMQNYWRGGKDNFAADRQAAQHAMDAYPDLAASVRANRAFQARAVRYLAGVAGVRQFLDIGTGLPTEGSVGDVARAVAPECAVVYVDDDPMVLVHARTLLTGGPPGRSDYIDADLRDPATVLRGAAATLDFAEPVAILIVSVLHMITDDEDPGWIVAALTNSVVPGSYLVITHVASDIEPEAMAEMARRVNKHTSRPAAPRDHATVASFFAGLDLVPPGVVRVPEWRPDTSAEAASPSTQWAGLARKP